MDKKELTPEQEFFNDKTLEFAKELYGQNDNKINEAYKGQKENRDDLLNKIAKILLSYNILDNIMKLGPEEKKNLYSELSNLIIDKFKSELDFETNLTKNILYDVGKSKYSTNNYLYSLGIDFKLTQIDDKALENIINTKVEDKIWSDRLYNNKNDMSKVLRNEIKKFLNGETNVNEIENKIKKKYNENAYETKRLVQDNICRVQEGANDVWQHDHGIKKVMYMATLDGKVCSKCAQYDTKVFDVDKKPVQIPQHPFCRCVYISLPDEDWHPKTRLDNETKKNINWQSYEEWKKNLVQNQELKITKKDINNNYSVNRQMANSKEYHDKFENLPLNKAAKENIYLESKKILEHRDGKPYEDLVVLDARTGKEIVSNRNADNNLKTGLTKADYEKVTNHKGEIVLLHNHPGGGRPSIADILTAFRQGNVKSSIVVGHDGTVNSISNINRNVDIERIYNEYYNEYKQLGYESQHARIKATDDIYEIGVFKYTAQ
ncbi:SPP1 gp7 family putative phage head morphogenesis protein [Clostridium beijerinckii]|uniref:minor capsid protein n=1 Tax=Clostridium beijerinckii TaxID=1520 RepID=UPI00156D5CC0|nr:minor capsid protein [Clostridium beijerinckii]NRT34538.1 SPP1 gp7 family putative phage head morphogenesis protein [Clostridium beijerinckii]NRT46032.1 SPP1 gp7 family putative phage head morphogenesis protein [Clostridium beijerinckii]NRZ19966.1 SPP1 gp7 family putative phage head morphogenesis protein [Clostridium beijerinckii]